VLASRESYLTPAAFTDATFINDAGMHAGLSLLLGGAVLAAAGAILLGPRRLSFFQWGVPALVVIEMIGFVAGQIQVAHLSDAAPEGLKQFVAKHPGDYRVLSSVGTYLNIANNGFLLGVEDLWGNNPTVLRRYAEFMTFSQGGDPSQANQYVQFAKFSPLYALLRLRYAFVPAKEGLNVAEAHDEPLSHLLLMSDWKAPGGREAIFEAMSDPAFNPRQTVLLESTPNPAPAPGGTGSVKLVSSSPEELEIEADTDKPAILLITDLYAHGWRAEALPGSVQQSYDIMPADYILRAIPLQAGHHHLRVVYAPAAFPEGLAVSAVAWLLWLGGWFWWLRPKPELPPKGKAKTKG
jgi:hypothetical protein